jgi:serine/threonine protein kinase
MSTDLTEQQGGPQRRRAQELSLQRGHPPTHVPGYEPERFLGVGAYGEVWVAVERNTGRRVAIKFYAHRGGLDWSLLSREVEKLSFLFADRYVVQLLGVGWEAEPPYYIMEYLERGSLADRLQQGPLRVEEAVALFEDVAVGLVHAHGKGVLHCDLKPANILLDQDGKPRLADFGQSRLSHEQAPALGTLFYMAPEQADLEAVPDARWDVYALGALLYCMLTGSPPYRNATTTEQFEQTAELRVRLARYRELIETAPLPTRHRKVRGVDRMLAEIIERCLAVDPQKRFANVQAVLDALRLRAARKARLPLMIVGTIGPSLLLAVVAWVAWRGFSATIQGSNEALTVRALESNQFAAQYVAKTAANELERRFELVEQVAESEALREALLALRKNAELQGMVRRLSDPLLDASAGEPLREQFRAHPDRQVFQGMFADLIPPKLRPRDDDETSSWFVCEASGVSCARVPESKTIGKNFAWRSYFYGGADDREETWRPDAQTCLERTTLSGVFRSRVTSRWVVAISTPVFDADGRTCLGVVAMTVEVGRLLELRRGAQQFAVLVDRREGANQGVILQHPLYDKLLAAGDRLPDRFKERRLAADALPSDDHPRQQRDYQDPLAADEAGGDFDRHWLARMEPVAVRDEDTGWVVIIQESYDAVIGATLDELSAGLLYQGLRGLAMVALLLVGIWLLAARLGGKPARL